MDRKHGENGVTKRGAAMRELQVVKLRGERRREGRPPLTAERKRIGDVAFSSDDLASLCGYFDPIW